MEENRGEIYSFSEDESYEFLNEDENNDITLVDDNLSQSDGGDIEDATSDEDNSSSHASNDSVEQQSDYFSNLQDAIKHKSVSDVKLILKKISEDTLNDDVDDDIANRRLIHLAAERGNIAIFQLIQNEVSDDEMVSSDENGDTILTLSITNCNWKFLKFLNRKLNEDILIGLYCQLEDYQYSNVIFERLLENNQAESITNIFEYNYSLAEYTVDDDKDFSDECRAELYYRMSLWKESDDLDTAMQLISKALAIEEGDYNLYLAYQASLYLLKKEYKLAYEKAVEAEDIQQNSKLTNFYINYVKTIYYLYDKNKNKYGISFQAVMDIYKDLDLSQCNFAVEKIVHCLGDLETKQKRELAVDATTMYPTGYKPAGKLSLFFGLPGIELRPYRNFKQERTQQLLRQIASQLYFYAKSRGYNLVELQILYLSFNGQDKLFIAANRLEDANGFFSELSTVDNMQLREILRNEYNVHDNEGKERSQRYAKKLAQLFECEFKSKMWDWNTNYANKVLSLLRKPKLCQLDLNYVEKQTELMMDENSTQKIQDILNSEQNIYLITGEHPYKDRHAEEFLSDIAGIIFSNPEGRGNSFIGGKMRPCIGCSGRLAQSGVKHYNERPGKLWVHTVSNQPQELAKASLNILFTKPTYISSNNDKELPSYDSGSDSESERDESTLISVLEKKFA